MMFPLVGNEKIKNALLSAIDSKRVPHAIIIEGESGLGKTTLAKFIAKAVLCLEENVPCNNCKQCHLVDVGSHPDLYCVEPEPKKKNITVDQIRELRIRAYQKPQMSESSVFLIDRAETLNAQSQNTLLKVLEEPPGNAVFVFLCNNVSSLLATVISRCIVYSLSDVTPKIAAEYLQSNCSADSEEIKRAVSLANGNIGRALKLFSKDENDTIRQTAETYAKAVFKRDIYEMLKITTQFEKDRVNADRFIYELKYVFSKTLKEELSDKAKTKYIVKLIDITDSLLLPLKTNINLPLLFTNAAYSYYDCK